MQHSFTIITVDYRNWLRLTSVTAKYKQHVLRTTERERSMRGHTRLLKLFRKATP